MLTNEIEEFAKILIENVRDAAIKSCDQQMLPNINTPISKRWRSMLINSEFTALHKIMISDCVDEVLFYLLQSIDQGLLNITFFAENGNKTDLKDDGLGELSGWYMGSDGWRAKYSDERYSDDFKDTI